MNNTPKVIELVVQNDLCIGCGLCVYKCPSKALEMQWNEYGFLIPVQKNNCNDESSCLSVCPFNPLPKKEVETENDLADIFLKNKTLYHPKIGKFKEIYVGFANEFRLTSSSGGIATYVMTELLEMGIVNYVISVKESITSGVHYEYAISGNKQELLEASKTKYYPVTLSEVLSCITDLEGKVAIVGVACFIKAIRLAQFEDPILKEKIPFLIGIICGGVKSRFFTEYLSEKAGIPKELFYKPEFRVKGEKGDAGDYFFSSVNTKNNQKKVIKMRTVGDMWGTGFFKANACDYCDDVTTELADISLGDAWIEPYVNDSKGTNVVITRSSIATEIIQDGIQKGKITLDTLSIDSLIASQQGSFNHRHKGLEYRIKLARYNRLLIPPKRITESGQISFDFKIVQRLRLNIRKKSLELWKNTGNTSVFDKKMRLSLTTLRMLTKLNHFLRKIYRVMNK